MVKKKELSEAINTLLGTEIKWEKLDREDLEEVAKLFNNPRELIRKLLKEEATNVIKERSGGVIDTLLQTAQEVRPRILDTVLGRLNQVREG